MNPHLESCSPATCATLVSCKLIYKIKTKSDSYVDRYKARLIARGFTHEYGVDYDETFIHVTKMTFIRTLLALEASRQWPLY